jgi:high-affinity iron transporter
MLPPRALPEDHFRFNKCRVIPGTGRKATFAQVAAKKTQLTGSRPVSAMLISHREARDASRKMNPASLRPAKATVLRLGLVAAAAAVAAIIVWQGFNAHGTPDPTQPNTSPTVAVLDIGVLVFREGLECILVLAAITASMVGSKQAHRQPVAVGAGVAFGASLITWFVAVGIVNSLTDSIPALDLQAATGLLAVIVLLVIMNWFFHKIYWGGWIRAHNRRRKLLLENAGAERTVSRRLWWGLVLLGFTSLYREGFEVVLFLQSYNLRLGGNVVLKGALLGLILSGMVAVLTFVLQRKLPYRKMLITTGVLLGVVLLVMVGEQAQEMQLAHWINRTEIPSLAAVLPAWLGMWFAVFPTYETLAAQALALVVVVGSYYAARRMTHPSEPMRLDAISELPSLPAVSAGRNTVSNKITNGASQPTGTRPRTLAPTSLQIASVAVRK